MSAYTVDVQITIGALTLPFANEVDLNSTWREMSSTGTVKLPRKALVKQANGSKKPLYDYVTTGMPVVIKAGYNGTLKTEFIGYVQKSVKPVIPVVVSVEDEMWHLKRMQVKQKVFTSGKVSDLIKYLLPDYTPDMYDIFDTDLGSNYSSLNMASGSVAQALKKVEDTFGLKSFFRLVPDESKPHGVRNVLVVGRPYSSTDLTTTPPAVYKLRQNTKGDTLEYKFAEDNPVQIKGVLKVDNGKDIRFDYPPELLDSSTKSRQYYAISESEFKEHIKADWLAENVDKYEGSITGFLVPYVRHGMAVNITDEFYENRSVSNEYFVDGVGLRITLGGGVERIVKVGAVVSDLTLRTFK